MLAELQVQVSVLDALLRPKLYSRMLMASVIRRYLGRELLNYWLAFTLVLWLVLVTVRFSIYLGQAAGGELPADLVLTLLGLKSIGFFVFLMPLTLFLAVLWLLGRLNRDYESVALSASGLGAVGIYRALLGPLLVALLLVTLLSFYLVPLSAVQGYQLRAESEQVLDADSLTPGRFHSLRNGRWLLYAESSGPPGELQTVFVHMQGAQNPQVLLARRAMVRGEPGDPDRYLVMQDGHRYQGLPGQADYRVLAFREYTLKLQAGPAEPVHKWDAVPTHDLWDDPRPAARAEWQARLARPLSLLVLFLIAVPLARFRPASSRYYPLWLGVLVFAGYFNLLATGRLWLAQDVTPGWLGLWWVHLLLVAGGLMAFVPARQGLKRNRHAPA